MWSRLGFDESCGPVVTRVMIVASYNVVDLCSA